jgi:hypothetical protein
MVVAKMSEVWTIVERMKIECPAHEGAFDCTPFCDICEGEQEYEYTDTRPCIHCEIPVDHDIWFEELKMCVDCSHKYYNGEMD